VLRVTDGSATLTTGPLDSFTLDARIRLTDGGSVTTHAGDAGLTAAWGAGGGLELAGADPAVSTALPASEQAWVSLPSGLSGEDPDLVKMGSDWFLYRSVGDDVYAATSVDGIVWTDIGVVAAGTAPSAVVDGGRVVLYSNCGGSICRVEADDGVDFGNPVAVADGDLGAVAVDASGVWRLWYTDVDGLTLATSSDGVTIVVDSLLADDGRLHALDVLGSYDVAWDAFDGVHLSHDADPSLADDAADVGPLELGCDLPTDPALALDGLTWRLAATCDGAPSIATGVPTAGTWTRLHLEWDGTTLTAIWGDAAPLTTSLAAVSDFSFEANGTLEIDEAVVTFEEGTGDSGDSGDTGETGETGETGDSGDTGDSADSGVVDSGDSGSGALYSAADITGEPGGCGCASQSGHPSLVIVGIALAAVKLRRKPKKYTA